MEQASSNAGRHEKDSLSAATTLVYNVGMLASRMVQVERTLCDHPDGRAENDAEHSYMLALIAVPLAEQYFPEIDSGLVAKYALVHDLVEAYVGDTPTHNISQRELQNKAKREKAGLKRLREEYAGVAPSLVALVDAYEAQNDSASRFVRMLDKLVTVSIQFPNSFSTMKRAFDGRSGHETMVRTRIERFLKEYPDQQHVLELYAELAHFMQQKAWPT